MTLSFHALAVQRWVARPEFEEIPLQFREAVADRCHQAFLSWRGMVFFEKTVGISAIAATILGFFIGYRFYPKFGNIGVLTSVFVTVFTDFAILAVLHEFLTQSWLRRFLKSDEVKKLIESNATGSHRNC